MHYNLGLLHMEKPLAYSMCSVSAVNLVDLILLSYDVIFLKDQSVDGTGGADDGYASTLVSFSSVNC
jgi:hypothetical protein